MEISNEVIDFCNNKEVNDTLNTAYKIFIESKIPFNADATIYINEIYKLLNTKMKKDPNFLLNTECILIHNLFENILNKIDKYNIENINIENISKNDILLIKCNSCFASYHFLLAVINKNKKKVNIYQSFGSSVKLFKKTISYIDFIRYLKTLHKIQEKKPKNFVDYYTEMLPVEENLYGIDVNSYIEILNKKYSNSEDYEEDEDDEDLKNDKLKAESIKLPFIVYENLENEFNIAHNFPLEITAYRLKIIDDIQSKPKTKKQKSQKPTSKRKKPKSKKSKSKK